MQVRTARSKGEADRKHCKHKTNTYSRSNNEHMRWDGDMDNGREGEVGRESVSLDTRRGQKAIK